MNISRLLVGFIGMPLGILILYYRVQIKDFIGDIGWAEHYLGAGGTWTALALIGFVLFVGSMLWMFGVVQEILVKVLDPLF